MADIFLSYASADRPRAETLKIWFEQEGWSVWIDRDIGLGEDWGASIQQELHSARLVIVLWSATARRSAWVQKEALAALQSGRLLQIHGTGLPLLPPFDAVQAVRMQSWSGELGHSERLKLMRAAALRLEPVANAQKSPIEDPDDSLTAYRPEIAEAFELAFYYCARQLERVRATRERGYDDPSDFEEIRQAFAAMLALLRTRPELTDDREGVLHRLMQDFNDQLLLLVPDPDVLT